MTLSTLLATIITTIFVLIILSYYVLLFVRRKSAPSGKLPFRSITIAIPARNEQEHLGACVQSVLDARFPGKKQIIVIDDGSLDATVRVAKNYPVLLLRNTKHLGKSASLNKALKQATGDLFAVVDADSVIAPDALLALAREVSRPGMGGAAAVVKVKNRKSFLNPWVHLELLYASLLRSIFAKVNANVTTPGALSMYRTSALREVAGFSTQGFSEDLDIAIRLIRKGYHIGFSDKAVSETNMPDTVKGFLRQRTRFARGTIYVLKRHMQLNSTMIDLYTLPLFLFTYVQAIIMGSIILWQLSSGYVTYFASKGVYLSWGVAKFFFEWFSIVGTVKWMASILSDPAMITLGAAVGILSTLLTYPLFLVAILSYDKKIDWLHVFILLFMFPFWFILMIVYLVCSPEIFVRKQYNRWKKNE